MDDCKPRSSTIAGNTLRLDRQSGIVDGPVPTADVILVPLTGRAEFVLGVAWGDVHCGMGCTCLWLYVNDQSIPFFWGVIWCESPSVDFCYFPTAWTLAAFVDNFSVVDRF